MASLDRGLRLTMGWDRGPLGRGVVPFLKLMVDWPEGWAVSEPLGSGLVGWFLSEALFNAIRHGAPYDAPTLRIVAVGDTHIEFSVTNPVAATPTQETGQYRGLGLLQRFGRSAGWTVNFGVDGDRWIARWSVPVTPVS